MLMPKRDVKKERASRLTREIVASARSARQELMRNIRKKPLP